MASRRPYCACRRTSRPRAPPRTSSRAWGRRMCSAPTARLLTTLRSSSSTTRESRAATVVEAWAENGVVTSELVGPDNPFVRIEEKARVPFEVHLDPDEPVAKLVVGDEERILRVGEWSDWVPVSLDLGTCGKLMMTPSLPAMGRFLLKSIKPEFRALCLAAEPRSDGSGDADLDAARLRRRAGRGDRQLLTPRGCPRTPRRSREESSTAPSSSTRRGSAATR